MAAVSPSTFHRMNPHNLLGSTSHHSTSSGVKASPTHVVSKKMTIDDQTAQFTQPTWLTARSNYKF